MAKLDIVTIDKKQAGSVDLDPAIFEAQVKPHLFHAEVRRQLAKRHRGTHSTRNRSAVSGGGDKPWRQKGTGRARQGTIRAPQWAGGGVVFGPVPRSYAHSLPKKVRKAALRSALSLRMKEDAITVVDEIAVDGYSTRRMVEILKGLELQEAGVLIVIEAPNPHVEQSARNLRGVTVLRAEGLNVYDVLRHSRLLISKAALAIVEERLKKRKRAEAAVEAIGASA